MNLPKKTPRSISGWFILNKPQGIGSTKAVSIIKKYYGVKKAGHAGTLDPLASGILPIALNEATKTIPYIVDSQKSYDFTICWGEERDSGDLEGKIIHKSDKKPTLEEINAIVPLFIGEIVQTPPQHSAIKINGERAYKLARQGLDFSVPTRKVTIYALEIIAHIAEQKTRFSVHCSKGTYIRSLAQDIAKSLKTYGYVIDLHRKAVGPFSEENAVSLPYLEKLAQILPQSEKEKAFDDLLLPLQKAISHMPIYEINPEAIPDIQQGKRIKTIHLNGLANNNNHTCALLKDKSLLAITEIMQDYCYPKRVFKVD